MSEEKLGIINPDGKLFSDGSRRRTGKYFDFRKQPTAPSYDQDELEVFKNILGIDIDIDILGIDYVKVECNGTAFRFALRRKASELSETIYDGERVRELFQSFKEEGHLALMFLKNIAKIEFYTRKKGSDHAEHLFSFSTTQVNEGRVREKERSFMGDVKEAYRSSSPVNKYLINQVNIDCYFTNGTSEPTESSKYIIVHYYGGQLLHKEQDYTSEDQAKAQGLIPLVGVAYQRSESKSTDGHIFCALPLPVIEKKSTGLPVHVNGYFALGPDRKDLKWPSLEQSASSDKEVSWNLFLLQRVLPAAYIALFQQLKVDESQSHIVYNSFPDVDEVDNKWRKFAVEVLSRIFQTECLWSDAISTWISPKAACTTDKSRNGHEGASAFLKKCASPVVCISEHVVFGMDTCSINVKEVHPKELVNIIARNRDELDSMTCEDRIDLLRYALENPADITGLFGVPILPLEDGGFARPQSSCSMKLLMISNDHPIGLVPGCEKRIIKTDMQHDLIKIIKEIAVKGICQVTMLNETNTAALLKETHVNVNESKKILSAQEIRALLPSWFPLIWGHINKYGNLEHYQGLPLIPMTTGNNITQIAVLRRESVLIYSEKNEDDDVISLFEQLGCTIIKELPSYVLQNSSVFKCKYIYEYVDENLLQLLSNLESEFGNKEIVRKFADIKNAGKLELLRRVPNCHVGRDMYALLRSLPFIESTNGTRLVSVDECQVIAPKELPDVMPQQQMLLKIQQKVQVSFIEKLGGRQLSKREFIEEILLPEINKSILPHERSQSMINYILASIAASDDKQQWQKVIDVLSSVQFVKSDDEKVYTPTELFHRSERLEKLFLGEEGRFPNMRQNVEVLKLKNESDVSADDIRCSLAAITRMEDIQKAQEKAKCILEHLECHMDLLENERLRNEMKITAWIPINRKRPDVYPDCLAWYGEKSTWSFGKLAEMVTKENSNLVGSVRTVISSHIEDFIAIKHIMESSQINHQDVIDQLLHVIKYDCNGRHKLMIVLDEIYRYLEEKCNELTPEELECLKCERWVWCGNCFVKPQQIVLQQYHRDMRPYMYNLPQGLPNMNSLLVICGSVAKVGKESLIHFLNYIQEEYKYQTHNKDEIVRDRKICVEVLRDLGHMPLSDSDLNKILVPIRCEDAELLLQISTQTVYSSMGGFNYEEEKEEEEDLIFLHECITEDIVKRLRIRSLTSKLIDAEDLGLFEEYGQHEPLTRRINRILADYGDGLAIVKEIIQNADDAGAVEVKFLYDERLNEDKQKYLIDPGMKDVQGPALWAYNDAKFSKEDFDNIVKLSGATKEDKRDKIGKFGLGFNAVYNITDVPSFISDNQLVILDPHTTHLGHAIKNKSKPGVKIPLGPKRNRFRGFQDQIRIYDGVFGMDASLPDGYKLFEGTLFRFPLRTERQAQVSEIKKLCYSKDEMKELVRKFSDEASRLLLFTQNVRTVEFFHLEEGAENAANISHLLHVSKEMFMPSIEHGYMKANDCQSFNTMKQSSLAVESRKNGTQGICIARSLRHAIAITTKAEEVLQELFEVEIKYGNERWVIHSSIDDKKCMSMALESPQLNPVASVAVCIKERKDEKTYSLVQQQPSNSGYFYCFLPLPMPNGLNVHINSTFALSKDRKSFQERSEDDKMHDTLETIWNRNLMSGPVSSAYIGLLKDLTNLIDLYDEATWYSLWPQNDVVSSNMLSYRQELIRSFYHSIIKDHACVFPKSRSRNGWLNWTQIMTIEGSVRNMKNGNAIEEMMEEVLNVLQTERVIVHLPQKLLSTIEEAGFIKELSEITISFPRFFSKFFIPHVEKLRNKVNNYESILLFAINNYSPDSSVCKSIKAFECIPTQPSDSLRKPSDLVKPKSKAADLFEVNEEVFPIIKFEDCYGRLVELGMLSDTISWELLLHRAKTINALGPSKSQIANARVKKLLQLMEDNISENRSDVPELSWRNIEFLPVKPKPSNWLFLEWEGTRVGKRFAIPNEIYPNDLEKIIGCHKLIIDNDITGKMSSNVKRLLGVRMQCTVPDIIKQVDIITQCIKGRKRSEMLTVLPSVFTRIYRSLSDAISKNPELQPQVAEGFRGKAIILTNDNKFVKSEQVAFNPQRIAEPYLYKLQNELAMHHGRIMEVLGVKETFSIEDYNRALKDMEKDAGGNPLSDSQINTVRDLLESIDKGRAPSPNDILLPDKDKVLRKKESVVVKERVWMKNDPSKRYLHDRIPPQLALSLGAKTERSHSIASQSRGLPFGQHEKLTVRLKRILEAYPSQIQILYELLQNADDAGASEVKFILDKRQHGDEKVFGDAWKSLQGPALLVFNDAPFTHRDIEGIQNLGEGSKSDDCQKTGQYGIGFNVVYHVTDAPCLLTKVEDDSVLCIFDPHARFLEECSDAEPGRMFTDGRNYLQSTFPEIYNTFIPRFLTNENSAILRLPLRSPSHALSSSIKQRATTTQEILEMFQSFKEKGPEAIIFLRNVKSVEIFIIEDTIPTEEPLCVFSVHADMTNENKRALSSFNKDYKSLSSSIRDHSRPSRKYLPFQYELTLRTSKEKRKDCDSTWRIIQKCASINPEDLPSSLDEQYKNGKLPLIPVGGIAYNRDKSLTDGKVYCLLPLAVSSSLPLHINGKFILDYESRRRLWYTSEDSFQKTWNYYVIEHCIVPCYVQLFRTLTHQRMFAFGNSGVQKLLENALKIDGAHPKRIEDQFRMFPKLGIHDRIHEYEAELIKTFYKKIAMEEVEVMPVLRPSPKALTVEFFPPNSKIKQFYYIDFFDQEKFMRLNSSKTCISLLRVGMNIYNIPADIVHNFSESGVPLERLTPDIVNEFLRSNAETVMEGKEQLTLKYSVFGNITTVEALLQYCAKCENFSLDGLPLLVTEDEELRRFDNSKHVYYEEVSILFPSRTYMILHPKLRTTLARYIDKTSGALRKFMLDDFSQMLDQELHPDLKKYNELVMPVVEAQKRWFPTKTWLRHAWNFLRKRFDEWKRHIEEESERITKETPEYRALKEIRLEPLKFLEPISKWCLFPVERSVQKTVPSKEYNLIGISKASNAVDAGRGMKHIIDEVGLPVPSSLFVENYDLNFRDSLNLNTKFLMDMATDVKNVSAFIDALIVECKRKNHCFPGLLADTAKELLKFLSRSTKDIDIDRERRESLKSLPVWEDLSGELKSISSAAFCYLICDEMPKNGISLLQSRYNVLLLKKHFDLSKIYMVIELETQDDTKAYCHFILEHFAELQPEDRLAHLSYLRDKYTKSDKIESELLQKLKQTKIIEKNGKLSYAEDFYDPEIKLFTAMLDNDDFPSEEYKKWNWLPFLRLLGLVSKVSSDLFCSFAKKVSQIQEEEERRKKSEALIEHFREADDLKEDSSFLYRLSLIPFLVADKLDPNLSKICPGKHEEGLLCFRDAVMYSDKNIMLSWTIEHILPFYASKFEFRRGLPFKELGAVSEVPSQSVARNLENVSKSQVLEHAAKGVKRHPAPSLIKVIYETAYEFLYRVKERSNEGTFTILRRIPMILVNGDMISIAQNVTMENNFNIPPYLFSMPFDLGRFLDLFKKIGMSEKPTIHQLVKVLDGLFSASNGSPLDPNEAKKCQKVISRILEDIGGIEFPSDITRLPLPGCYGGEKLTVCLYQSQDLVYFDDAHLDKRLLKLGMPKLELEFMREQLPAGRGIFTEATFSLFISKLPIVLRPKKLSDIVKEIMTDSGTISNSACTGDLHNLMKCIEFAGCMMRLLKHQESERPGDSAVNTKEILELLSRIEVIAKQKVETVLVLQPEEIRIEESECEKEVFVTTQSESLKIYISSSLTKSSCTRAAVAKAMVSFFGGHFKDPKLSPLVVALLEMDPSEMHRYLDSQGIRRGFDDIDALAGLFYSPGKFVPIELHCLLINDVSKFDVGDYVAYEVEDPGLDDNDGDPVYIYAKILECITKDELKDFYKIDIGMEEPIAVHKSQLYGFHRPESLQEDNEEEHVSMEEVKESIKRELEEAFKQGEEYAKRIIKRLWLKWHPDKNIGKEEFCTEIFKFIQAEAGRLRGDSKDSFWHSEQAFKRYSRRGRKFNQQKHNFRKKGHRGYSWSNGFWRAPNDSKNPQPGEARRWLRQGTFDLQAARGDPTQGCYEWVCFKCHQAAEKCLRAAVYGKDAKDYKHDDLRIIASATENTLLKSLACQIESLLRGSAALRYPNQWCFPSIPHDKYDANKAGEALKIAEKIFEEVNSIVN